MAVNRKKIILTIVTIGAVCIFTSACSKIGNIGQFSKENGESNERPQRLQEDKLHSLGEAALLADPTKQNPQLKGAEYTVHTAALYENPEAAGIDTSQVLTGGDTHYDLETGEPTEPDVSKADFFLCDVTIKNIRLEYMNITDLSFVCALEGSEELKMVGYPAYFSKPEEVEDSTDYYNFNLPADQSIDAKVGWWVDLEECRKESLYLMFNYGGDKEYQEYWELDL